MIEGNGMEDFKNRLEGNLLYFHTYSILNFVNGIQGKYKDGDK